MPPVTPSVEPSSATAGSTWTWTASSAAYPVSEGWALSYVLTGVKTLAWSAGYVTDDGATFTVLIPATATATLSAGRYEFTRVWTGSGAYAGYVYRETLDPLTVAADPATALDGDRVTFAETNLAAVEAALTARIAGDQPEEYTIGGMSVRKMSIEALTSLRTSLQGELWKLRNPGLRRQRVVRFTVPSA